MHQFFKILLDDDTEQLGFKSNKESFCTKFRILNGRGDAGRLALLFKRFAPLNTETTCCMLIYVFTYNGITFYCLELPLFCKQLVNEDNTKLSQLIHKNICLGNHKISSAIWNK